MIAPAPLVPSDVDLQNFGFMPLDLHRLRRSKTWRRCRRNPEIGFYCLNLWAASWHELPAGSLEDDDDLLADSAMCSGERWNDVRDEAMAGWVKCSDGRWYHRTVAEKVMEAWAAKCDQRLRTLKGRIAAMEKRLRNVESASDREHVTHMLQQLKNELTGAIAQSVATSATKPVTDPVTDSVTEAKGIERTGTGQGEDRESIDTSASADRPAEHSDVDAAFSLFLEAAKRLKWTIPRKLDTDRRKGISRILKEWDGLTGWRDALAKAEASDFLSGRGPRSVGHENWRVDLDFLLSAKKFRKLAEGGYGGERVAPPRDTWAESLP